MAITIDIDTARPYQVHVGTFLLEQAGPLVRATAGGTKAVIVTDTNVGPLYQMPVKQSLEASGYEVSICTFEAGEAHKRAETYVAILEFVAEHELSRSDVIVALGGGVVGDVAGFVAATYMRGCKFVQIPTSLLAMVDSSVGGKTAIDLAAGKNLAGVFWQPSVVIADVGCLATLTPEQFADGCGEVVKHAVIADPELFAELEKTPLTLELLNQDVAAWRLSSPATSTSSAPWSLPTSAKPTSESSSTLDTAPDMPSRPARTLSWGTATACQSVWASSRAPRPCTAFATPNFPLASRSSARATASRPAASFRPTPSLPRHSTTKSAPVTLSNW